MSFIAQKLLIQKKRKAEKWAQDALYVHDTLEVFREELDRLTETWREQVRPGLHPNVAKELRGAIRRQFGTVTDRIRDAVRIPADRQLSPERVQRLCEAGLQAIFGTGDEGLK